ncbi:MAG TPA: adenylate kinase [Dehalococcoidia bacterium]|nr:adenylate kinase [Dehalococcoidia bacterium]
MFLVLLGAPGAGKGTQAAIISRKVGLAHIASGDLFRQAVEKETKLGQLVKAYMDKGILVPDEVTIQMISERLNEPDCKAGCVFDGFPRTMEQAKALDKALANQGKLIDKAVYIEVSEEELLKRLSGRWICHQCQTPYHEVSSPPKVPNRCDKCGGELYQRSDDTEETVKERLKVYFAQTTPVLNYYEAQGKLIKVDGKLGIEKVAKEIIDVLRLESMNAK